MWGLLLSLSECQELRLPKAKLIYMTVQHPLPIVTFSRQEQTKEPEIPIRQRYREWVEVSQF